MTTLKEQYHSNMSIADAEKMILQTLKNVMEDGICKDNVEISVIRSESRKMEKRTPAQLDAVIQTLT